MWEMISTKDRKKYQLVDVLFRRQDPLTVHHLAEITDVSQRSVMNYLEELRMDLLLLQGKIITSKEGIALYLPPSIGIDTLQRKLFRESTAFKILETLFFRGKATADELEALYFLSPSTLDRLLRKLKKSLEPYQLSISGNPLTLHGEEPLVRRFFTQYFMEAYSCEEWPFPEISKKEITAALALFPPYCDEYKRFIKHRELLMELSVSILRTHGGFSVKSALRTPFMQDRLDMIRSTLKKELQKAPPFSLCNEALLTELSFLKLQYTASYYQERLLKEEPFRNSMQELLSFIEHTSRLFGLKKDTPWPLIIELYKVMESYAVAGVLPKHLLFESRDYIQVSHIKLEFPFFYTYVAHTLKEMCEKRGLYCSQELIDEILYTFIIYSENLTYQLFMNFKTCRILLFSHLSRNHAAAVKDSLTTTFSKSIQVEVYQEAEFRLESLNRYDFDLLLSTTTLHLPPTVHALYLSFDPKGHHLESLKAALENVVDRKKKNLILQLEAFLETPSSHLPLG